MGKIRQVTLKNSSKSQKLNPVFFDKLDSSSIPIYNLSCSSKSPSILSQPDSINSVNDAASIKSQKKNYKSLTRERRVEANARERSRVHTISAAFEALRYAVPTYCNSQKLSKLGILRIACCYIESLNQLLELSESSNEPYLHNSFNSTIVKLSQTIASESKMKNIGCSSTI